MRKYCMAALLVGVLVLVGCARPLPPERSAYVGEWQSTDMALLIRADGTAEYKRRRGSASTSVNGPIKEFVGDDFVVGIGPLSTTFKVDKAPHLDDGTWKMVVDGVELTRR